MLETQILRFSSELKEELTQNILPFWLKKMPDSIYGGFQGRINGDGELIKETPKGAVLNARILWTFSAAYRLDGKAEYLEAASRVKEYLIRFFLDQEYGGVYWLLQHTGTPLETRKQIYAQGFAIYGLTEYYRVTGDKESLHQAIQLFHLIELHSFDPERNGYLEAFSRKWEPIDDMRLSEKDANTEKTMNTHLHLLEAYTNLYRVWKNDLLRLRLKNLIEIFLDIITDSLSNHLHLFFDADWNSYGTTVSFGHDIEASWLLPEAAEVLGDKILLDKVVRRSGLIAKAACEGLQSDGSMIYEANPEKGQTDKERHWWVQAETVTGLFHHFQRSGSEESFRQAVKCWEYIKENLIDKEQGEWFWSILPDGTPNRTDDKAGIWKCPYHNGRMCIEINI